ncbi:MAG: hypothetical protein SGILL_000620 [Bacillariaceae sp.]
MIQGKELVNGNVTDSNGEPLLMNSLLESFLGDGTGGPLMFQWELPDGGYTLNLPGINPVTLTTLNVGGLDTLNMVSLLNPTPDDPQTIQNEVGLDKLTLDLEMEEMTGENGETTTSMIGLAFEDVTISVPLLAAIDQTAMAELPVGALLQTEYMMPCLTGVVDALEMSSLDMTFGTIEPPTSDTTTSAVFQLLQTVFISLPATVPAFFDAILRPIFNNMILDNLGMMGDDVVGCPTAQNFTAANGASSYVDFREFLSQGLPSLLKGFLESEMLAADPETGLSKINGMLIQPMTLNQSGIEGTLIMGDASSPLVDFDTRISVGGLQADIQLRISDIMIENLDTMVEPIELLEAVDSEPYLINNTATMGLPLDDRPMSLSTRIYFSIETPESGKIANEMDVNLDIEAMNLVLVALLKVAEDRLYTFPIRDIMNLDCWLATIPAPELDATGVRVPNQEVTAGLADFSGSMQDVSLNITCVNCTSSGMEDLEDLLLTSEAQDSVKVSMTNMMDDFVGPLLGDVVQFQIDRMLSEAALKCPHRPEYNPNTTLEYQELETVDVDSDLTYLMLFGIVVLALIVATAIIMCMVRVVVRRRHRRFVSSIPKDQKHHLMQSQARDDGMEGELNATTSSMFLNTDIPFVLRWSMPLIILGNIGLFLSGHLSLGATVNIEANIAGETITVEDFYQFSVARSTIDIWNAGGKALALLILIFSGIWPYTKQLITLVVWFLPTKVLSVSKRGSILLWMDWLAKWSMVDIFVIIVTIAAFRVSIQSPGVGWLPEEFYSIDLLVIPMWGLYSNMIAQLVSQISSHFILHYHRKIVNHATTSFKHRHQLVAAPGLHGMLGNTKVLQEASSHLLTNKTPLKAHKFGRPHRGDDQMLTVKNWVGYLLVLSALCVVGLVVTGCILPSLATEIFGVIGLAVESGQNMEAARTEHSVFTIVALLMDEAKFLDTANAYIGLGVLCCLFLFTVLVVPIVQTMTLLRQWFSPMTMSQRTRNSIVNETLQAWQYVEVYLISLFVACWQLGPISEFMFNTSCEGFNGAFAQLAQNGLIKNEDAQCFSVEGYIEPGSIILAVAAVLLALLNTFVGKACRQYFWDQKAELEKELFPDDGISDLSGDAEEQTKVDTMDTSVSRIHPVPVMFTDTFRWLLEGSDSNAVQQGVSPSVSSGGATEKSIERALTAEQALVAEKALNSEEEKSHGGTASRTTRSGSNGSEIEKKSKKKKKAKTNKNAKKSEKGTKAA